MLLKGEIPSLINGVSQQPPAMRQPTQCEEQINCYSSIVDGLRRRPGSLYVTSLLGVEYPDDCFVHFYERNDTEKYIFIFSNKPTQPLMVYDLKGNNYGVYNGTSVPYLCSYKPREEFRALSIADTTFLLNMNYVVKKKPEDVGARAQHALIYFDTSGVKEMVSRVYIDGVVVAEVTCGTEETQQRSTWIASELTKKLKASLPEATWLVVNEGNVIYVAHKYNTVFNIKVTDSRGNTVIKCVKDKIKNFNDLPKQSVNSMLIEITGVGSSKYDNYYVKFVPNSSTSAGQVLYDGYWVECAGWGKGERLDPDSMPIKITREVGANNSISFRVTKIDWTPRKVGDETTAPMPSFVGNKIKDIFFYRNRLGFLSDENAIYSEVGEYYNFFPTTVTTRVASDPIDNASAHKKISELKHAVTFQDTLIFTTEQAQFYQDSGEVFSGDTAAIKNLTDYDVDTNVAPVSSGKAIFLPFQRGDYFGVREYFVDVKGGTYGANDVTSHVPHFLAGRVRAMDVCMNEDTLICLSDKYKNRIYVYKWYWNGEDKLQSSWSYWDLPTEQVLFAKFIGNRLYCVCLRPGWQALDIYTIPLEPGYSDINPDTKTALGYEYALDCKMLLPVDYKNAPVYWAVARRKKISGEIWVGLPMYSTDSFTMNNLSINVLDSTLPPITTYSIRTEGAFKYLAFSEAEYGEAFNKPIVVGKRFTSKYKFSTIFLRKQTTNGASITISEGRLQLRKINLIFGPSGPFRVVVAPKMRPEFAYPVEYTAQGTLLGEEGSIVGNDRIVSGKYTVPILSRNTQVDIHVESDSILPFSLLSLEWVGFYSTVAKEL